MTGARARSNLIGAHARTLSADWTRRGATLAVERALEAGFDLIEVPAPTEGELSAEDTRRLLDSTGLAVSVSLALRPEQDINSTDDGRCRAGEDALGAAVQFAASVGARYVGGVTFSKLARYDRMPSVEARANSIHVLQRVARRAAADGIELGVEYVNRYESNLLNTAVQTVAFLDELAAPNVGLHLDTYHANSEDPSLRAAVTTAGSRLKYIHAAENHRGALGTGSLDWDGLFAALREHDYLGPITFESFSPAVVSEAMAIEVGLWRSEWEDVQVTATAARRFLAGLLASGPEVSYERTIGAS